jgi:pilus assembly protein Flp/PilA
LSEPACSPAAGTLFLKEEDHSMLNWVLVRMFNRARGQGMLEYALIIALVAVVVIASLVLLGPQIASIFSKVNNNL